MSKKTFYRYNPSTDSYERVYPSWRSRMRVIIRHTVASLLLSAAVFVILDNVIDFPRERMLKHENKQLRAELDVLNRRMDVALSVLDDIGQRDNNFYRVIMQADRITDARRYAGLDRTLRYNQLNATADNRLVENLTNKMTQLERMLYVQSHSFDQLCELAGTQKDRLNHIPAIQPISEHALKQMASGYGTRIDPIYGTGKFHEGMDFSADIGTPVYATGNGRVNHAEWNSGYGNMVEIDHGYNYTTRYAHLSKILVTPGQNVKRGDLIGLVGNTGKSTGPHLHYEVRFKGQPQNPVNYYFYDLTPEQYAEMIRMAENAGHVMD